MDENIAVVYRLHKFVSTKDPDFIKGLNIYSKNIAPNIRTNTSEIIYWLDEYKKFSPDSFFVFGFYQNKKIIGFAQIVYFKVEGILAIDYMVIDEQYRGNNTFFEFANQIRNYFANYELNYIVAEIVYNNDGPEPCEKSKNLIRLLKISHFKVIKAPYYQPMLGINNFESEMKAILMLYYSGEFDKIKKETYTMIVNTIYYKHYLRWYNSFFTEENKVNYINSLNKLFEKLLTEIKDDDFIELNGHHHLPTDALEPPKKHISRFLAVGFSVLLFLLIFTGLMILHLFLKKRFEIEANVQISILVASIIGCLVFLSFLYRRDENFLSKLIDKLIDKIT